MKKNPMILIAEDNTNDVELTLSALNEANVKTEDVEVVNDGEEALNFIFRKGKYRGRSPGEPKLILLDIKMPKIDGHEVLRKIKQDPVMKLVPVVMLISSAIDKDIKKAYEYHANGYVVKPVSFRNFRDAVKALGKFWIEINRTPQMSQ